MQRIDIWCFSGRCLEKKGHVMFYWGVQLRGHMMFGTMGCRMEDEQEKEQLMEIMRSLKAQKGKRKI